MNILDLDLDAEFKECFTRFGSPVIECNCGREHVCINSYYFKNDDDDVQMAKDYRERAKTDEKIVLNEIDDDQSVYIFNHVRFAEDCECEGWKPYMSFILNERTHIRDFLIKVADKAEIALEHEQTFNILKDKKFKVLDDSPF